MREKGNWNGELSQIKKNRETFPAILTTSFLKDDKGNPTGMLGVFRDITERKRVEIELNKYRDHLEQLVKDRTVELARSNKELEQFAAVASHDLQEPLRMITSYVQLLSRRYKGKLDSDADEFIGYAADGAKRLHMMINDLLNYSRLDKQPKPLEPVDSNLPLNQALINLQVAIQKSGAVITHDSLPAVMADQTHLVALFQNLVGNAVKFRGEAAPRIHISAKLQPMESSTPQSAIANPQSTEWVFAVKDNGIGIEPQYFNRVFDIFQRLHPIGKYPGTGIGLATCKKVVERHGGRIWIESQPGQGSTFYFTISATKQEAKGNE